MKKILFAALLFASIAFAGKIQAQEVKGNLTEINGIPVLQVWGNHYERGYAYGNLMAQQLDVVLMDYFIARIFNNNKGDYSNYLMAVQTVLLVDQKYKDEAKGIADGFNATSYAARFNEFMGRDLQALDMLFANSIVELESLFGCSSLMSWGDATLQDPDLQGELVITRHLDWQKVPELYNNHIVIAANPSEEDEQKWVSFGFPGLFGCLSGVNESSLVAFQHMGNQPSGSVMGKQIEPIFLAIRNAIEMKDYNKDGVCNTSDLFDAVGAKTTGGGFIVDAAGAIANGDSAIVIESDMDNGTVSRVLDENSNISGTNLVATNHFRKLVDAESCDRYDRLQEALLLNDKMTISRSWEVLKNAAGLSNNLQTIEIVPADQKILLSLSTADEYSWNIQATEFHFDDFFKTTGIEESKGEVVLNVRAYPNPVVNTLNISLQSDLAEELELNLCDLNGAILANISSKAKADNQDISFDMSKYPNGVYIVQIRAGKTTHALKIVK